MLGCFGMKGVPFRRFAVGMASRELLVHHFNKLGVYCALADKRTGDMDAFRQKGRAVIQALRRMFRLRIGS